MAIVNPWLREGNYIGGEWVGSDSGQTIEVMDPATGKVLGTIPDCGAEETERAIAAAAAALPAWRALPAIARCDKLARVGALMLEHIDDLAGLMVLENGKPMSEARAEIKYSASFVRWFAEEGRRIYGEVIPASSADKRIVVTREPVGVTAAITPWNFPSAMLARKFSPALAAGCTMVARPADETPYSSLAIAALCQEAGIPGGVLNVITGDSAAIGEVLCASKVVRKLSFTGSTRVGRLLMKQCSDSLKRLSLELGGNAPFIVFEDADLDAAAEGAMASKFRNCGQTCVASNRFIVHGDVVAPFAERIAEKVRALQVGSGLVEGVDLGPMINQSTYDKVRRLVQDACDKGAVVVCGGVPDEDPSGSGLFIQPTVLTGVTDGMDLWEEEIFGPVIAIRSFHREEDAVKMANDTEFGLASYFYTQNLTRSWRVREALEYGMVGVNTGMMSTAEAPFGGVKQSGLGREGSRHGIEEYTNLKYTCIAL